MKKFSESSLGILILSIVPAVSTYFGLFNLNLTMENFSQHIATHAVAYSAISVWLICVIILLIRRSVLRSKRKLLLIVRYIELIQEENYLRFKNNELNEDHWRETLLAGINQHFKHALYKQDKVISHISRQSLESEELSYYKNEKVKSIENELNKIREELKDYLI